jgi:pimeloyl-ACP methyl ester carboxylesterase
MVALAVLATVVAATAPQASGRGSSEIVGVTNIGTGAGETWALLPGEEPPSCLVVFLHGAGDPTPSRYMGWLDHLVVGTSCAVIFPRYQVSANTAPTTLGGLRAGVSAGVVHLRRARFGFEGFRAAKRLRTIVVGVGLGGSLAFHYAANAKRWGLPVPAAIDSIFPTSGGVPGLPLAPIARSTQVLVQVGDEDRPTAADLRAYLASHPASRTRFQTVRSRPGLKATVDATLQTTASAASTFWAPLDALIDGSG